MGKSVPHFNVQVLKKLSWGGIDPLASQVPRGVLLLSPNPIRDSAHGPHSRLKTLKVHLLVPPHAYTQPCNGPSSGTTWVTRYQKGKTNLNFTEARDSEWQWHQLGHMQVSTSLQTENYASTPPLALPLHTNPYLNQIRRAWAKHTWVHQTSYECKDHRISVINTCICQYFLAFFNRLHHCHTTTAFSRTLMVHLLMLPTHRNPAPLAVYCVSGRSNGSGKVTDCSAECCAPVVKLPSHAPYATSYFINTTINNHFSSPGRVIGSVSVTFWLPMDVC